MTAARIPGSAAWTGTAGLSALPSVVPVIAIPPVSQRLRPRDCPSLEPVPLPLVRRVRPELAGERQPGSRCRKGDCSCVVCMLVRVFGFRCPPASQTVQGSSAGHRRCEVQPTSASPRWRIRNRLPMPRHRPQETRRAAVEESHASLVPGRFSRRPGFPVFPSFGPCAARPVQRSGFQLRPGAVPLLEPVFQVDAQAPEPGIAARHLV